MAISYKVSFDGASCNLASFDVASGNLASFDVTRSNATFTSCHLF